MRLETLEKDSFYHLYNRGINKSSIFSNEENKRYFLKQYNKYLAEKVTTFVYCLLQNHFHLVVRIEKEPKDVIQSFSNFFNSYIKSYNKAEKRTGSLFEKHFKRIKVDSEDYLRQLIIYVNLNPLIYFNKDFKTYVFSSYNETLAESSKIVKKEEIMDLFGGIQNFQEVHDIRRLYLSAQLTFE